MRIFAATVLLVVGVALVATTAEIGVTGWAVGGSLCLSFVPALIFDAVVAELRHPHERGGRRGRRS